MSAEPPAGQEPWPTYEPPGEGDGESAVESHTPPSVDSSGDASVNYGPTQEWDTVAPAQPAKPVAPPSYRRTLVVAAVLAVGVMIGGTYLVKGVDAVKDAVAPPDLHSSEGFEEMIAEIEEESGGSEVFRAVVYPEYAALDIPAESTGKRQIKYYYDGGLAETAKGQATSGRVDLRRIDVEAMLGLLEEVRSLVEDPTNSYLIIEGSEGDDPASMSAYVTNEFSEGGYIQTTLAGEEIRRYLG